MATSDGRYLLQLRDDRPSLPLHDHWVLFGGQVELGETAEESIRRELAEELGFRPAKIHWYHEAVYVLPRAESRVVRRVYFVVPIEDLDFAGMVLREGADMRLFTLAEILALPRVSPWDLGVITMLARGKRLFGL